MSISNILFKVSNSNNKENYPIFNHEMLRLPIFKEDTDDKLYKDQNNQVDESHAPKNVLIFKSNEITTKETINQDVKNNAIIREKKTDDANNNFFAIEISGEEGEEKKEEKKCGRKRKGQENGVKHSKYSDDNLRRKIKHIIISALQSFINNKIKEIYHGNLGQGMTMKQILTLNHEQKRNINIQFNKDFLGKTLGEIFSDDLSSKYTNFPKDHNRKLIIALSNEDDESKRSYFRRLFNLTFLNGLEHFRGSQFHEELIGLKGYHETLERFQNEKDYESCLEYYINNFEVIIRNKKSRNRTKSENKSYDIIIN
jgi:hypothetical protein